MPPLKGGDKDAVHSKERGHKPFTRPSTRATAKANTVPLTKDEEAMRIEGRRGRALDDNESLSQDTPSYGQSLALSGPWALPPVLGSSKSKSTAASRSSSPTKTMADLDLAEPPIRFVEAGGKGDDPPDGVLLLHTQFLDLADGFGALPGSLKVCEIAVLHQFIVLTYRLGPNPVKAERY